MEIHALENVSSFILLNEFAASEFKSVNRSTMSNTCMTPGFRWFQKNYSETFCPASHDSRWSSLGKNAENKMRAISGGMRGQRSVMFRIACCSSRILNRIFPEKNPQREVAGDFEDSEFVLIDFQQSRFNRSL